MHLRIGTFLRSLKPLQLAAALAMMTAVPGCGAPSNAIVTSSDGSTDYTDVESLHTRLHFNPGFGQLDVKSTVVFQMHETGKPLFEGRLPEGTIISITRLDGLPLETNGFVQSLVYLGRVIMVPVDLRPGRYRMELETTSWTLPNDVNGDSQITITGCQGTWIERDTPVLVWSQCPGHDGVRFDFNQSPLTLFGVVGHRSYDDELPDRIQDARFDIEIDGDRPHVLLSNGGVIGNIGGTDIKGNPSTLAQGKINSWTVHWEIQTRADRSLPGTDPQGVSVRDFSPNWPRILIYPKDEVTVQDKSSPAEEIRPGEPALHYGDLNYIGTDERLYWGERPLTTIRFGNPDVDLRDRHVAASMVRGLLADFEQKLGRPMCRDPLVLFTDTPQSSGTLVDGCVIRIGPKASDPTSWDVLPYPGVLSRLWFEYSAQTRGGWLANRYDQWSDEEPLPPLDLSSVPFAENAPPSDPNQPAQSAGPIRKGAAIIATLKDLFSAVPTTACLPIPVEMGPVAQNQTFFDCTVRRLLTEYDYLTISDEDLWAFFRKAALRADQVRPLEVGVQEHDLLACKVNRLFAWYVFDREVPVESSCGWSPTFADADPSSS